MFKTFEEAEVHYYGLWYSETPDYDQALKVALWCYETFPKHEKQLMLDLGVLYGKLGDYDASLKIFNKALDQGVWYPKAFIEEFWNEAWFVSIVDRWTGYSQQDQLNSDVTYKFLSPGKVSKDKPIFIALHGWGEDIPLFEQFWTSDLLKNKFNTVFIQSSQMVGAYHYQWTDYALAKEDITKVLEIIKTKYHLDTSELYVGGFSEGATISLMLAFEENAFNVKGYVALNPNKPEIINSETIKAMKLKGVRGGIITGDQDQCYTEQLEMKALFETGDFDSKWIVTKDFGHWFPKDLNEKIDSITKGFIK